MAAYILLFIIVAVSLLHFSQCRQPRVTIENGAVVGKYAKSNKGHIYQSFEGIPYAKPPIDDKRFMEAEPLRGSWIGEWNATTPGSPCLQYDHFTRRKDENGDYLFSVIGDEDCLFVNVYTREGSKNKDVAVIIHGGAFMFGEGAAYGPEYMMDIDNLVYVTMNYRLGPLGFLTTGDSVSPGNNGLKDQTLALEWVQRNIAAFGGDPKKVTLIGLSAGGASVHYHFLSPLSKGLFARGYSFSGSALCPWAIVRDGVEKTEQLATFMGCPTDDSKTILKCLRRRPAKKIIEQVKHFQNWIYNPFTVFGPVVETGSPRPFIDDEPRQLLRQGKVQDLPWISSFTSFDGLYPAGDFVEDDRLLKQLESNWESIAPSLLYYKKRSGQKPPASKAVKEHYLGKSPISKKTRNELIQMLTDRLFVAPGVEASILQARANSNPVYLYLYEYEGTVSTSHFLSGTKNTLGASHGDDFILMVKFFDTETRISKEDKEMADVFMGLVEQYIRTGTLPASLHWEPVSTSKKSKVNYLRIKSSSDISMASDDNIGNVKYLNEVLDGITPKKDEL